MQKRKTEAEQEVEAAMNRTLNTGIKLGWRLAKLSDELAPKLAGLSDPKAIEQTLQEAINRIIKDAGLDSPLLNGQ